MRIDSFVVYICTNGNVTIETTGNEAVTMKAGETVLIPASTGEVILRPQGQEAQILEVYVP